MPQGEQCKHPVEYTEGGKNYCKFHYVPGTPQAAKTLAEIKSDNLSLLDQAKKAQVRKGQEAHSSSDLIDLAVAYYKGEVSASQCAKVLKHKQTTQATYRMSTILREAVTTGQVQLTRTLELPPKSNDPRNREGDRP